MTSVLRTPAVVVSGHTMALAVVRALGETGVPVAVLHYNDRDMAQASKYVAEAIQIPNPLRNEGRFIEALIEAGRRFERAILIPASDESTVAISRNKPVLEERYIVACPDWGITERFMDKTKTYTLADAAGVSVPRTTVPEGEEDLEACANDIGFPLLLKPAQSHLFYEHFQRKMFRVETLEELKSCFSRAAAAGLTVMLQEIIPGSDSSVVNYNAYVSGGQVYAEFTARQLRKAPPAFGSPRVAISERIPQVIEPGRRILAALGFYGFACTEFKLDRRDGVYKLMEVNGRHNLSGLLAVRCGVNFPLMHYRHLAEGAVPTGTTARSGVYWTDVFRDAGYSVSCAGREHISLPDYIAPYARRHCDAILDWRDMGPFWARLGYLLRNLRQAARASKVS